jgi:hypothetical protein
MPGCHFFRFHAVLTGYDSCAVLGYDDCPGIVKKKRDSQPRGQAWLRSDLPVVLGSLHAGFALTVRGVRFHPFPLIGKSNGVFGE